MAQAGSHRAPRRTYNRPRSRGSGCAGGVFSSADPAHNRSTNLGPYVRECAKAGLALFVRVLDRPESVEKPLLVQASLKITLSKAEARSRRKKTSPRFGIYSIGVLVTKDSGEAEASRQSSKPLALPVARSWSFRGQRNYRPIL